MASGVDDLTTRTLGVDDLTTRALGVGNLTTRTLGLGNPTTSLSHRSRVSQLSQVSVMRGTESHVDPW